MFSTIKTTQRFCCRKCFKKDYYIRIKRKLKEEKENPVFPKKICSFCSKITTLVFDPIKFPKLFDSFECPYCMVTNTMIWANSENPNSRQVILEFISSSAQENTFHSVVFEGSFESVI